AAADVLTYVPPTHALASALAGKHVVVIGSGHSAMTAVIQLSEVVRTDPSTKVTWALRRGVTDATFGGGA
ncbi:flavoprotein, partial [Mycobacterium sp. ITM-2017-0098]